MATYTNHHEPIAPLMAGNSLEQVCAALRTSRYRYSNEAVLHRGLSAALTGAGIAHQHEVQLSTGRIDFLVDTIGIEVKLKGSPPAILTQLTKYALDERITQLILVTTRPAHRVMPPHIHDVPVRVLTIGGLSL